jgi:hypothetical protein
MVLAHRLQTVEHVQTAKLASTASVDAVLHQEYVHNVRQACLVVVYQVPAVFRTVLHALIMSIVAMVYAMEVLVHHSVVANIALKTSLVLTLVVNKD